MTCSPLAEAAPLMNAAKSLIKEIHCSTVVSFEFGLEERRTVVVAEVQP